MKNVVIISSSPRKNGNSDILCKEFRKGAESVGHKTETIELREKSINSCRACYACFQTGHCVIKDDMVEIIDKIQNADVLVIATPVYFLTMCGTLKTMIDRLLPKWNNLGEHDVYVILTGHDTKNGMQLAATELTAIFTSLGYNMKGIIWGEGVWKKGEVSETKAMDDAYRAGKNL